MEYSTDNWKKIVEGSHKNITFHQILELHVENKWDPCKLRALENRVVKDKSNITLYNKYFYYFNKFWSFSKILFSADWRCCFLEKKILQLSSFRGLLENVWQGLPLWAFRQTTSDRYFQESYQRNNRFRIGTAPLNHFRPSIGVPQGLVLVPYNGLWYSPGDTTC